MSELRWDILLGIMLLWSPLILIALTIHVFIAIKSKPLRGKMSYWHWLNHD